MRLRVVAEARQETIRISNRYDRKERGLGDAFLDELGRVFAFIKTFPMARRAFHQDTRRWPLRRFPYSVLYAVDGGAIDVLAIGHGRRGPKYWRTKTRASRRWNQAAAEVAPAGRSFV